MVANGERCAAIYINCTRLDISYRIETQAIVEIEVAPYPTRTRRSDTEVWQTVGMNRDILHLIDEQHPLQSYPIDKRSYRTRYSS